MFFASAMIISTAVLMSYLTYDHFVFAHITKKFGNVTIEVGWLDEPPLTGDLNNVVLQVQNGSQGKLSPILDAVTNATASIKYGTLIKPLDFIPSENAGLYEAKALPTRSGSSYSLLIKGEIGGQNINTEIPLDTVESKQTFAFPDRSTTDTSSSGDNISPKIQGVLSQLSSTVQNLQVGLDQMGKDVQNAKSSVGSFEASLGKTYFIALSSAGVGLAGIIIAAFALSRKTRI